MMLKNIVKNTHVINQSICNANNLEDKVGLRRRKSTIRHFFEFRLGEHGKGCSLVCGGVDT